MASSRTGRGVSELQRERMRRGTEQSLAFRAIRAIVQEIVTADLTRSY